MEPVLCQSEVAALPRVCAGVDEGVEGSLIWLDALSHSHLKPCCRIGDVALLREGVDHRGEDDNIRAESACNSLLQPGGRALCVAGLGEGADDGAVCVLIRSHTHGLGLLEPSLCSGDVARLCALRNQRGKGHGIWPQSGSRHPGQPRTGALLIADLGKGIDERVEGDGVRPLPGGASPLHPLCCSTRLASSGTGLNHGVV
mmetsp:Transcript_41787/g.91157  ORF Transcript_41787/g.91157 Transcript_41787/m.91157 type:complete len:201 (-) Transcript_41787:881-1483(-)